MIQAQLPDGTTLEFPEGTSNDVIQRVVRQQLGVQAPAAQPQMSFDPTEGMSGTQRFLAGVGKAITDVGRGAGQLVGVVSREDVQRARELDAPLMRTGAGTAGNIIGNVAMFAPTAMIPGANTITGAGAIGAASGLLQPSASSAETAGNVALGGVAGAAIPTIGAAYRAGKSLVEPFYEGGRQQILGRVLRGAAGDKADDAMRVMQNATGATQGVQPTVGMAARELNLPSYAALERATQAVSPDVVNATAARTAANQQAMQNALAAATPDVGAARSARETIAGALYNQARSAGIDDAAAQQLAPQIQSLTARLPDDVIEHARTLARLNGMQMDDAGSVQGLHWVKRALDDKINTATRAGSSDLARAYSGLQSEFLDTLDQLSPAYQAARQQYAAMSRPITQGEILGEISRRSTNARGDLTLGGLTRAATDRTAQSVTGMPNATLASTLTPQQQSIISALRNDLLSMDFAANAGRGAGSDTVQKLAYTNMLQQAGVPTFIQNFAPTQVAGNLSQRALSLGYGQMNQQLASELAEAMLNPRQAAELMRIAQGNPQMQQLLANALRSSAVVGATAPAIAQGQQ